MSDIEEKEPTPQEIEELSVAELFEHYPHIGLEKIRNLKGWKVDHEEAKTRVHPSITESRKREELRKKSKGTVITDIDIPFTRILWVVFQGFLAFLIIALPLYLVLIALIS
tara:strand:+ start:68 stop:400 length:333 start_codon:yes stop_codon:yes gene_type:complete